MILTDTLSWRTILRMGNLNLNELKIHRTTFLEGRGWGRA